MNEILSYIYIYITKERWNNTYSTILKTKRDGGYLINLEYIGGAI